MAAVAAHLADTSALTRLRHASVAAVLAPMIEAGLVATSGVIEFELGWAAPRPMSSTRYGLISGRATNGWRPATKTGTGHCKSRQRSGAADRQGKNPRAVRPTVGPSPVR